MKKLLILFKLLASFTASFTQPDSIALGKVVYMRYADMQGETEKNGLSTLLFNTGFSVFIHNSAPRSDSSFAHPEFILPVNVKGDPEGFPIYKMHKEKKILQKIACRQAPKSNCVVNDTLGTIQWVLQPSEPRRFGQYICQKAIGSFRGRDYEVWYTPEVPISSGPFKFSGLPGLILEARSTDNKVQFLFQGMELHSQISEKVLPPDGLHLNQRLSEFVEEDDAFFELQAKKFKADKGRELRITKMETIEIKYQN